MEKAGLLYSEYDFWVKLIGDNYDVDNEAKECMRGMVEGLKPEQVWLRCMGIIEDKLYGTLLNEPNQD